MEQRKILNNPVKMNPESCNPAGFSVLADRKLLSISTIIFGVAHKNLNMTCNELLIMNSKVLS